MLEAPVPGRMRAIAMSDRNCPSLTHPRRLTKWRNAQPVTPPPKLRSPMAKAVPNIRAGVGRAAASSPVVTDAPRRGPTAQA